MRIVQYYAEACYELEEFISTLFRMQATQLLSKKCWSVDKTVSTFAKPGPKPQNTRSRGNLVNSRVDLVIVSNLLPR